MGHACMQRNSKAGEGRTAWSLGPSRCARMHGIARAGGAHRVVVGAEQAARGGDLDGVPQHTLAVGGRRGQHGHEPTREHALPRHVPPDDAPL